MKNVIERGGPGSGFRGHRGRQKQTGGSLPRAAGTHLGGLGVPDFAEQGKRDFVSQQNIMVDDQMVVALVAMRKMEVFKLKPYRMEVRWYVRDRRGPATKAQATAGQALLDELVTNTEVMLEVQGWERQPDSRGYWLAPWVQEVELVTREDPEVQEIREQLDGVGVPAPEVQPDTGGWTPPEEGIQWFYDNDPSMHFYNPRQNKDIVESERKKISERRWAADVARIEALRPQTVVQRIGGAFRRLIGRHYGPGPHPGTGTEQTVHGTGGGPGVIPAVPSAPSIEAAERPEHVGASVKISRLINPVSTVHINDADLNAWQDASESYDEWGRSEAGGEMIEAGAAGLMESVVDNAKSALEQGGGYYETIEGNIDQNMVDRFVEELIDSDVENDSYEVEEALDKAMAEVEAETLGPNATWEDMRKYLDVSEDKMHGMGSDEINEAIKLKQGHALLDKILTGDYERSEEWVTNNIIGSADEAEMREIVDQAIVDERDPQAALHWRANDLIEERLRDNPYDYDADYIRENYMDEDEFREAFGRGEREEWVSELGSEFPPDADTYYYATDNETGETVAVMETSISKYGLSEDRIQRVAEKFGIDPSEVSDKFVTIDLLASKYPRHGYGTEMVMAGLKEAYDNDAGLTGSAVMAASMFYAKLGGQYLTEMGVSEGGTAFWTNVQVKAAYEWLESEKSRVKAGELTIGQLETAEGLARLEEQEEGTVSGEAHGRREDQPRSTGGRWGPDVYSGPTDVSDSQASERERPTRDIGSPNMTLGEQLAYSEWQAEGDDSTYIITEQTSTWELTRDGTEEVLEADNDADGTSIFFQELANRGLTPVSGGGPTAAQISAWIEEGSLSADPTRPLIDSEVEVLQSFGYSGSEIRMSALARSIRSNSPIEFQGGTQPLATDLENRVALNGGYRVYETVADVGGRPMVAVEVSGDESAWEIVGSRYTTYEGVHTSDELNRMFEDEGWNQTSQGTVQHSGMLGDILEGISERPYDGRVFHSDIQIQAGADAETVHQRREAEIAETERERAVAHPPRPATVNINNLPALASTPSFVAFRSPEGVPAIVVELEPGIAERERWQLIGYTDPYPDSDEIVAATGPRFDSYTHALNQMRRQGFEQQTLAGSTANVGVVSTDVGNTFPDWFGDVFQVPDDTARFAIREWLRGQERATGGQEEEQEIQPVTAAYYPDFYGQDLLQRLVDLIEAEPAVIFQPRSEARAKQRMAEREYVIKQEKGLRARHYAEIHPGTGTDQSVHGTGGARGAVGTMAMDAVATAPPPRSTFDLVTGPRKEVKTSRRREWSRTIQKNETLAYLQTTNPMDVEDTNFFIDLDGNYYAGDFFHAHIAEIAIRGAIEQSVAKEGGRANDNPTDVLVDGVGFIRGWHRSDKDALGIYIGADPTREQERAMRDLVEFLEVQNSHWDYETDEQFRSGRDVESLLALISVERAVTERHYGPGAHPGTGTSQDVHGGGGARGDIAMPESLRPRPRILGRALTLDKIAKLMANPVTYELNPTDDDTLEQMMETHDWANATAGTFVRTAARKIRRNISPPTFGFDDMTAQEAQALYEEWENERGRIWDTVVDRAVDAQAEMMETSDVEHKSLLGIETEKWNALPSDVQESWMYYIAAREAMKETNPESRQVVEDVWSRDLDDRVAYAGFDLRASRIRSMTYDLVSHAYESINPRPEYIDESDITTFEKNPVMVAKIGNEVVGAAELRNEAGTDFIYIESIGSKYPGQGHGTQLMLGVLEYADDEGMGLKGDAISSARTFYERLGAVMARVGGIGEMNREEVSRSRAWLADAFSYVETLDLRDVQVVTPSAQGEMDFPVEVPKPSPEQMTPIIESSVVSVRHYGPGPHPGTGTPQDVHGTDGALRRPSKTRVGITSARPGKPFALVFEEMGDFLEALNAIESVSNAVVIPGLAGSGEWGREPTWVVSYRGDGLARDLIARTAMAKEQDSVILITEGDTEPVSEFTFSDQVTPTERDEVEALMDSVGFSGWTWFKVPGEQGGTVQAANISQWGGDPQVHKDATKQLRQMFEAIDMPHTLEEYMANVEIMEEEGDNAYQKYFIPTTANP